MAIEYFCCYHSYLEVMEQLNDTERGRLFTACLLYSKSGEVPELRGNERFVFPAFRSQIDRDKEKHGRGIHHPNAAGDKHWNWKGGITPQNQKERRSLEYKEWRNSVFRRDSYTCVWCGATGGQLHAHHKKPWASFKDLRYDVDNGITLCKACHKEAHRKVR